MHFSNCSDEQLYQLCQKYGEQTRLWRQKFAGLLPEVHKRRLYKKKGCASIFEFAKKLAGMSEESVRLVLNLEKRFKEMPILQKILENGTTSMHKLARIASVATTENQEFWATQVAVLPNRALETLVRDVNQNGLEKVNFEAKSLHVQTFTKNLQDLNLSTQILEKLFSLKEKGIDINKLLLELLAAHEQEIAQEKNEIATEAHISTKRYIPQRIKNLLYKEYGTKCAIKTCARLSQNIHHTQRFALAKTHDPHYLAPLCKEHHLIAHAIDLKVYEVRHKQKAPP